MTVDAIGTNSPTVLDARLPSIAYRHAHNPRKRSGLFGMPACRDRSRWVRTGPKS